MNTLKLPDICLQTSCRNLAPKAVHIFVSIRKEDRWTHKAIERAVEKIKTLDGVVDVKNPFGGHIVVQTSDYIDFWFDDAGPYEPDNIGAARSSKEERSALYAQISRMLFEAHGAHSEALFQNSNELALSTPNEAANRKRLQTHLTDFETADLSSKVRSLPEVKEAKVSKGGMSVEIWTETGEHFYVKYESPATAN